MTNFIRELWRRKVFTIVASYAVFAWVVLQVGETIVPIYDAPDWVMKGFVAVLLFGFPVALILAWVYDITPEGLIRTGFRLGSGADDNPSETAVKNAQGASVTLPTGPSIAVLPFANLSGDEDQDLFARALTGDISTGLTRSSHLFVLAADAASGLDNVGEDLVAAGKRLGVSYLLGGTVRKAGETLRVTAQLTDVSSGVQIWSQSYDRALTAENLFSVQDDIREQIVSTLSDLHGVIYSTQTQKNVHRPTTSLNAYECLTVALAYDKNISEENHLKARESLERAIEIDPGFDAAWAHLSWIYSDEYVYGFNLLADPMGRALNAARKGMHLAPGNYHNHWLLSRVHYFMGDREQFLGEAQKSLELNASDGTTLGLLGMYIAWSGEWQRGLEMVDKARQLNPNFPDYYYLVPGFAAFARRDYQGALDELRKASMPGYPPYQVLLASSLAKLDREADAGVELQNLQQIQQDLSVKTAPALISKNFPFLPGLVEDLVSGLEKAGLE